MMGVRTIGRTERGREEVSERRRRDAERSRRTVSRRGSKTSDLSRVSLHLDEISGALSEPSSGSRLKKLSLNTENEETEFVSFRFQV